MPRYKLDSLPPGQTDWERLRRDAEASGRPDDENPAWTSESFREADLVSPGGLKRVPLFLRAYEEVVEYYKSFGKGYQTRMNNDLLRMVRHAKQRHSNSSEAMPAAGVKRLDRRRRKPPPPRAVGG